MSGCGDDLTLPSSGEPSLITAVGGNGQTGTVGQALDVPLEVEVTDPAGRPVPGVEVVFIAPPGAELTPNDTVLTGSNGRATVNYTLATVSGQQSIEARAKPVVPSASLTTTFSLTAMPESATGLIMIGGDDQVGDIQTALADSLAVKAVDRFGNGVPGVEVTWEASDGGVSPATVTTGADGRAATQRTLGGRPGSYRTEASATDLEGSPVEFTATGIAPPSPQIVAGHSAVGHRRRRGSLRPAAGAPAPGCGGCSARPRRRHCDGADREWRWLTRRRPTTARSNAEGVVRFTDLSIRGTPGDRTLIFAASDFTSALSRDIDRGRGSPPGQREHRIGSAQRDRRCFTTSDHGRSSWMGSEPRSRERRGDIAISIAGANPAREVWPSPTRAMDPTRRLHTDAPRRDRSVWTFG